MKRIVFLLTLLSVLMIGCEDKPIEPMPPEDTTPPKVVSVSPEKNSEDVPVNVRIFAVFSEKLSSKSNSNWLTLTADNKECPGTVNVKEDTILFATNSLEYETEYTAHISADVTDEAENHLKESYSWNFTTAEAPDTTPPEVVSVIPEPNEEGVANDVSINIAIEVDFNEAIDTLYVYLKKSSDGSYVEGFINEMGENYGVFVPKEPLEYSSGYIVYVSAVDIAGNEMKDEYSWEIYTEENPNALEVVSTYPEDGAVDVPVDVEIRVEFDKEIASASISGNSTDGAGHGFGDDFGDNIEIDGKIVTLTLNYPLEYSLEYAASVDATDTEGNNGDYSWLFTTEENPDE